MVVGDMTERLVQQAHRKATAAPLSEIAGTLQELLSRRLTAYIAGVGDGKTVHRWATGEVSGIRDHAVEQRLRATYEIVQLLLSEDAAPTVKAWFIGLDPLLGDISPAEAIHDGRLPEVFAAAHAFMATG